MWLFDHLSNTLTLNDSITFNIKPLCYFFICCSDLSEVFQFPFPFHLFTFLYNLLCTFSFVLFTVPLQGYRELCVCCQFT